MIKSSAEIIREQRFLKEVFQYSYMQCVLTEPFTIVRILRNEEFYLQLNRVSPRRQVKS